MVFRITFPLMVVIACLAPWSFGKMVLHSKKVEYPVRTIKWNKLVRGLASQGPKDIDGKRYPGFTEWKLEWTYKSSHDGERCFLSDIVTTLEITTKLPEWTRVERATPRQQKEWKRFRKALETHEKGHRDIALNTASSVETSFAGMEPIRDCAKLEKTFEALANSHVKKAQKAELAYDERTHHGRDQGAFLNLSN